MKKLFLLGILILFLISCSNNGKYDSFVNCLDDKNVKMYGAFWCGHCKNQKEMFSDSEELFINKIYVECDLRAENNGREECQEKGITGYPTWTINNEKYPGVRQLEYISAISGCSLQ